VHNLKFPFAVCFELLITKMPVQVKIRRHQIRDLRRQSVQQHFFPAHCAYRCELGLHSHVFMCV
jgi:hypothetical protein